MTRKVTAQGAFWRVQIQKGRRLISKGIWAPVPVIAQAQNEVETVRSTAGYQKRVESERQRRGKKQDEYEKEFCAAVRCFLAFASPYSEMEEKMAAAITAHAIPVGSGTVARTAMIPVEKRAVLAVIAWMRHKTTAYDAMKIPREKGRRREVRKILANRSVELLEAYRKGEETSLLCPLKTALR